MPEPKQEALIEGEATEIQPPHEVAPIQNHAVQSVANPLDLPVAVFRAALDRRKDNRTALMEWVKSSLVDGTDMGKIHVVGKDKCSAGRNCTNPGHFSKPSLFKPGAEKICGMLGLKPTFPTLKDYEDRVIHGGEIAQIILRCHLIDGTGATVADGVGARSVSQDYGDLNKSLKMCAKSAQIDATLRCAGLSEVFTQDIEDMKLGDKPDEPSEPINPVDFVMPFGKHKGSTMGEIYEIDPDYLDYISDQMHDKPDIRKAALDAIEAKMGRRIMEPDMKREYPDEAAQHDEAEITFAEAGRTIAKCVSLTSLQDFWEIIPDNYKPGLQGFFDTREKELTND